MAIRMEFDNTHNIIQPTFVLATRNGTKLGAIITTNESLSDNMNSHFELRFDVHKADNDNENDIWNKLQNFRLIWCREWDIWFEAYVEIQEDNELVKSVECVSLGEAELSQILLHNIEINTETDIDRDDYVPTVLFNDDNHNASLLHRIMEKAPHYSIHHVDSGIANIQRTFTFDNTSIYDAFQDIAEEINCIFVFDSSSNDDGSIKREINVYDLESYCLDCGHRGDFRDVCPECESDNVLNGYGEDTTIFVSVENLADQITYTTDTDSVKNCFKLEAGDDLMTATVMNCNPNGSGYVWYISDDVKADMSDELVAKLNDYDALYEYYQNEHTMTIPSTLLSQYNGLVTKYHPLDENLTEITNPITGYSQLMNIYYDTIEFYLLLHDTLMPTRETSSTSAAAEAAKLTAGALSPVAVQNINTISVATASNAVLSMAKVLVSPNYQVKVGNSALNGTVWSGDFVVTNYSDSEDTAVSETISITINGNYETFIRQKIDKSLNSSSNNLDIDATSIFKLGLDDFKNAIKRYCLASLTAFSSACQSCMELLIEQGIADNKTWANKNPNMYEEVYLPYYRKMEALQNEIKLRESEINIITGTFDINGGVVTDGVQTILERHRNSIQAALNFEEYIGSTLWLEFNSYRREDVYSNSNYISDGLNNAELFKRANEFIESANREAFKSATLQHSISASLKDLLVMEEFAPIVDKFAVGNWIRVKVNDEVFRLRLISYTVDFTKLDSIDIEFSDVKKYSDSISDSESILSQAASMASSYDAVSRQASQGSKANRQISYWVNDSLALTKMKIVDSADNQNITWDEHGLLCREYLPITDDYSDKQLKIINKGIYVTDDGWLTSKAGLGDFTYFNPDTGLYEEGYGVIADTIVGNIILGDNIGIYNESGAFKIDENGLTLTSSVSGDNENIFTIQRDNGDDTITKYMYIDRNGDVVINANSVRIASLAPQQSMSSYIESTAEEVASSTASDVLEEWVEGDFTETIHELQDGIVDAKIETYYQTSDPSTAWTTSALKSQHAGDIWYNSTASIQKYYRWDGTAWEEMRATPPKAILDTVDGKATIYTGTSSPSGMHDGDLWFEGTDKPILTYVNGQWVEFNKYSAAIQGVQTYAQSIGTQVDGMAEIHYGTVTPKLNNAPANAWSDNATKDLHVDDLYYNTSDGYCYRFTKNGSTYSWERIKDSDITAAASAASDANDLADQKRRVFVSQPTPPYDAGDLWVEGENGDIWRCATPKITGQRFAQNDWVKASKYTDDTAASAAMSYAEDVMDYAEGLGGLIDDMVEIHYGSAIPTLSNAPANSWSNTTTKDAHLDDLYYDTTTGYCYRFTKSGSTYSWSRLKDKDITAAADLAGQKRRVFVNQPYTPYEIGDLWVQGINGDIMKCKTARATGNFVESDWEKASKYTDDSALETWIQVDFAQAIEDLQDGITDAKVETWYQTSDPSTAWNTSALQSQHAGDIWYNSTSTVQKYYRWSGTAWQEMTASPPKAVMDSIDGKATIFTGATTPVSPSENDLWFKSQDDPILTYVNGEWVEYNKYTTAIENIKVGGRNLIRNTLVPNVSANASKPNICGDTTNGYLTIGSSNSLATAEHGVNCASTKAIRPILALGTNSVSTGLHGLIPGKTYTLSFDWSARVYSGSPSTSTTYYLRTYIYYADSDDASLSIKEYSTQHTYDKNERSDRGAELSGRTEYTFAVPEDAVSLRIVFQPNSTTNSHYATGDYIEMRNIKLEAGNKATDWTPAPEDMNAQIETLQEYADSLSEQVDGMAEIHYGTVAPTLSNAPANSWSSTDAKDSHVDDLYYDTATGYCYRFTKSGSTYSWERIKDSDIASAASAASAANTLAGQKRRIFVSQPYTPYESGDLWVQGINGDIMRCINPRATGNYVASDWEKASKYTDDTYLTTWINGTFAETIQDLQDGIADAKVETWYQTQDPSQYPSPGWNTTDLKNLHKGDIWYNSTSSVQKYYRWSGTVWEEMRATPPQAVMDEVDGKATIFTGTTTPSNPNKNDLWFKGQDEPILTYINGQWVEYNKYTDDSAVNNLQIGGRNLLLKTAEAHTSAGSESGNVYITSYAQSDYLASQTLVVDETILTLSFDYEVVNNSAADAVIWPHFHGNMPTVANTIASNANRPETHKVYMYVNDNPSGHYWVTFKVSTAQLSGGANTNRVRLRYATDGATLKISNMKLEFGNKATDWTPAPEDVDKSIQDYVTDLQEQIDGKAETWYQEGDPSTTWTTDDLKKQHSGDLWYRPSDGATFYYMVTINESTGAVVSAEWVERTVPAEVFNAINGKAQIFTSVPSNYNKGDLWIDSESGDILVSINANEEFVEADWVKASKYTDDSNIGDGKNLIINTNIVDISDIENLPRIYNQPTPTSTNGVISAAEHGFRVTVSSASRPAIRFGSNDTGTATMNGLTAGETYTLSFDSKWKMCSAQSDDQPMNVWLHDNRADVDKLAYTPIHSFGTAVPNVDTEGRCECTFTIPENVTMCNIYISAALSSAASYAATDYLELSNIKLEKGGRATAWTPAVEDILKQFESIDSSIAQTNETVNDLQNNIETWMNFDGEALTIGKKYEATPTEDAVEFATVIDSESLSFTQNGDRVAYINSNKLFIENAEIKTNLAIGNYLFKPHEKDANGVSDGGMSLVWNA